ncbi:replication restart helicase PriA [Algoriphagus halophytocola]|uniref:Replication restart protein PriA n=1 Tax=Algoriphagus halophytocola TaxID=2991499 RepID=A0ABY6MKS2_9BACT|nr:primosomal protein N' [Algoriphagus sp. TR-M5]UZD24258.1 primosomal protein N' [Algoriphagus sp. TR-M5]
MESLFSDQDLYPSGSGNNFADIILPVPIPRMFTYSIPYSMQSEINLGSRVIVQFGKKKVLTGIIGIVHNKPPQAYQAKPILEVLDDTPSVNPLQIRFWVWMAEYYFCHIGEVMHAALPTGLRLSSESKVQLNPNFNREESKYLLDTREILILDALDNQPELSYEDCEKVLSIKSIHPILKSLVKKEAILIFEKVQEKYTPKVETRIRLTPEIATSKNALQEVFDSLAGKAKQESVLLKYLRDVPVLQKPQSNEKGLDKATLLEEGDSESSVKTLIKNGIFESFKVVVNRLAEEEPESEPAVLSSSQQAAFEEVKHQFESKQTVLLHGVTGSGKTEIYIQMIREVLDSGSQVLLLLPEIALTTQIVTRLKKVFGSQMGVYHSKYSDNERVEVWNGVLSGRFSFVVGVRSSIFLPFDSLGLIIVDEEHEASYKQFDPAPRFQARDSAIMLAYFHQARTLLGSATPSFESYFNASQGKFGYVELTHRFGDASMPQFHLADMAADRRKNLLKLDTTRVLREKIQDALAKQEQVLIFQNRRGYSPYIQCEDCGWTGQCVQCDVSLTYHQFSEELRCHYCGYKEKTPSSCPACGSTQLTTMGMGTERIEESLSLLFPEARIARMDLDTTRNKHGYQRLLDEFGSGNLDILVGTQMITKGLDFGRVTVVGIWDGDRILNFPDFRAGERAYQQITQVAGRAGRREAQGQVILQTRDPETQMYAQVIKGDYFEFFNHEIHDRKKFYYPPFVKLVKITTRHADFKIAEKAALNLHHGMAEIPIKKIVLGPEKGIIARIKNQYQFESLIKLDRSGNTPVIFKEHLWKITEELKTRPEFRSVRFVVDVDPS